jgi:hypothetical protein
MKKLFAVLLLVSSFSVLADCEILKPNSADRNERYCSGTNYGVTYNGFMASDSCYTTLKEALYAMRSMPACDRSPVKGNCSILNPNRADKNDRYCSGTTFAVTYNGFMAEDACHTSIDKAMAAMDSIQSCKKSDSEGKLSILYPNRADKNGHYCSGISFSVTYEGFLIEDQCYTSIDKAMALMESF